MWQGWMSYNGNEIINVARTEAYAKWAALPWFKPVYKNDSLSLVLGDGTRYVSPLQDFAPWVDADNRNSFGFYGLYPLNVTGVENSSRTSTITESIRDGGSVGRLRHGTKAVVVNGILVADDEAAAEYGFQWLKQALLPGPCSPNDCTPDELCFLASEPMVDLEQTPAPTFTTPDQVDGGDPGTSVFTDEHDGGSPSTSSFAGEDDGGTPGDGVISGTEFPLNPADVESAEDCFDPLLRSLRDVLINQGPTITDKRETSDGGAVWTVQFTAVAGEPWTYGAEVEVLQGFLDPDVEIPWSGGTIPAGGFLDLDGFIFGEKKCAEPVFSPIQDPLFPTIIPPPLPPSVPLGNYTPPANWRRRQITVPANYIPLWTEVVPKVSVHARTHDLRNLRLRFYADVNADGDISDDPCAYCGDIVISYVPKGFTLVFDGSERQVYAFDASQQRRPAGGLVFATDGSPFEWPTLSCGFGYIVTFDLPQTQAPPVVDLSLFPRVA